MKSRNADIMSKKILSIHLDSKLEDAYWMMMENRIRHLPVRGNDGGILGMLSDRDLQRAMRSECDAQPEFDPALRVEDVMSWPIRGVRASLSAKEAAERMLSEKISALLVMDDEMEPVGIITTDDLLKLLVKLLAQNGSEPFVTLGSVMDDLKKDLNYLS